MKLKITKTLKEIYSITLKDLSAYGGFPFYGLAIIVFLYLGDLPFAYSLVVSLLAVTAAVAAVRLAYFKPRPGQKKRKYETLYERLDNSSFPSIHAARTATLSLALFSKAPAMLPLLVLLVLVVCLSRLHFRRHDPADVIAGLVIGAALGLFFLL